MGDSSLLENYNPLYDVHLRQYFSLPHMQKHLRRMGMLDSNGVPVSQNGNVESELYARHHNMMSMMLKNRERILIQLADLQRKFDAAEKVEIYRRIRSGLTAADEMKRTNLSRSLSRPRRADSQPSKNSKRRRASSNSFEDTEMIKRIETAYEQPNSAPAIRNTYDRLSANAFKYAFLHKLDDTTLHNYKDSLMAQLQKLQRFRDVSFGPYSFARHQPTAQNSWFFRRRSLKSIKGNGTSAEHKKRAGKSQSPRRQRRQSPMKKSMTQNAAGVKLPPMKKEEPIKRAMPPSKPPRAPATDESKTQPKSAGIGAMLAAGAAATAAAVGGAVAAVVGSNNEESEQIDSKTRTPSPQQHEESEVEQSDARTPSPEGETDMAQSEDEIVEQKMEQEHATPVHRTPTPEAEESHRTPTPEAEESHRTPEAEHVSEDEEDAGIAAAISAGASAAASAVGDAVASLAERLTTGERSPSPPQNEEQEDLDEGHRSPSPQRGESPEVEEHDDGAHHEEEVHSPAASDGRGPNYEAVHHDEVQSYTPSGSPDVAVTHPHAASRESPERVSHEDVHGEEQRSPTPPSHRESPQVEEQFEMVHHQQEEQEPARHSPIESTDSHKGDPEERLESARSEAAESEASREASPYRHRATPEVVVSHEEDDHLESQSHRSASEHGEEAAVEERDAHAGDVEHVEHGQFDGGDEEHSIHKRETPAESVHDDEDGEAHDAASVVEHEEAEHEEEHGGHDQEEEGGHHPDSVHDASDHGSQHGDVHSQQHDSESRSSHPDDVSEHDVHPNPGGEDHITAEHFGGLSEPDPMQQSVYEPGHLDEEDHSQHGSIHDSHSVPASEGDEGSVRHSDGDNVSFIHETQDADHFNESSDAGFGTQSENTNVDDDEDKPHDLHSEHVSTPVESPKPGDSVSHQEDLAAELVHSNSIDQSPHGDQKDDCEFEVIHTETPFDNLTETEQALDAPPDSQRSLQSFQIHEQETADDAASTPRSEEEHQDDHVASSPVQSPQRGDHVAHLLTQPSIEITAASDFGDSQVDDISAPPTPYSDPQEHDAHHFGEAPEDAHQLLEDGIDMHEPDSVGSSKHAHSEGETSSSHGFHPHHQQQHEEVGQGEL